MSTELAPGTAVFETDFVGEAKFYAQQLGPDFCVTAGIDTMYAVRVKESDAVVQPSVGSAPTPPQVPEVVGGFTCITKYDPPPIPDRRFDWSAYLVGASEDDPVGWGATKAAAIADLLIELESV